MQCPIATMQFFRKNSTFYGSLILTILFFYIFNRMDTWFHGPDAAGSLALEFSYTMKQFHAVIAGWASNGISVFRWMLAIDMLFPFVYGALLVSSLMRLNEPRIIFYPMVVSSAVLDWLENVSHLLAVSFPSLFVLGPIGAYFALIKWILIAIVIVRILILYSTGLFQKR